MLTNRRLLAPVFVSLCAVSCAHTSAPDWSSFAPELATAQGLIVVTTKGWNDIHGHGNLFLKRDEGRWYVAASFPLVVGRAGLAWGKGIADFRSRKGPKKREGDGRSPAGIYRVTSTFGKRPPATALPYQAINPSLVCVDDPASSNYNRILSESAKEKDWTSAERAKVAREIASVAAQDEGEARPLALECEATDPAHIPSSPWGQRVDKISVSPAWKVLAGMAAQDRAHAFSSLVSRNRDTFWTSGQWMTERRGSSEISHTSTVAKRVDGRNYTLKGIEWYASATTT